MLVETNFCKASSPAKKIMNSSLKTAAETRRESRLRDRIEGTWSLFQE